MMKHNNSRTTVYQGLQKKSVFRSFALLSLLRWPALTHKKFQVEADVTSNMIEFCQTCGHFQCVNILSVKTEVRHLITCFLQMDKSSKHWESYSQQYFLVLVSSSYCNMIKLLLYSWQNLKHALVFCI